MTIGEMWIVLFGNETSWGIISGFFKNLKILTLDKE